MQETIIFATVHYILQIISLTLGIIVLFAVGFFQKQSKNRIFIFYGLFLLSFVFTMLMDFFPNELPSPGTSGGKWLLFFSELSDYTILLTAPLFFTQLFPLKKKTARIYIGLFLFIFLANLVFESLYVFGSASFENFFDIANNLSMAVMLLYIFILLMIQYKKVEYPSIKRFLRFGGYLFIVFLPLIVVFDVLNLDAYFLAVQRDFDFDTLFFIAWNIASIFFFLKYFQSYALNSYAIQPSPDFQQQIGLSEREQDVIPLLIKGLTYKEIGEKLFISPVTVKSHVLSIYRKAGVKNKIALLDKIKQNHLT